MADQHTILVPIAMYGAVPSILVLFAALKPHRAVIWAHILGWLFLPWVTYEIKGTLGFLPDFTRTVAIGVGVAVGVALFDFPRVLSFRPRWLDACVLALCTGPLLSSLANGLGVFDGLSAAARVYFLWGQPYLLGRIYLDNRDAIRDAAVAVVIGSLIYVPLCLFELRMSPQIYRLVYGDTGKVRGFTEAIRFGGWRPRVFFEAGLALGVWMSFASMTALGLVLTATPKRILGMPTAFACMVLVAITIACKAIGALLLLVMGLMTFILMCNRRTALPVLLLVLIPPTYISVRTFGIWDGSQLVDTASAYLGERRAQSLEFRFENEDMLAEKALQRPLLGWGGWGRQRVKDDYGKDISTTDGLWIIELGEHGLVGLSALYAFLLLPPAVMALNHRIDTDIGFVVHAFAISAVLYSIDCLLNGMPNPVIHLAVGAVASWALAADEEPSEIIESGAREAMSKAATTKKRPVSTGFLVAPRKLWPPR